MSTTDVTPKPFEQIKQILRDAAKEKESAYGGFAPKVPLALFLTHLHLKSAS
jgi:hypothetical protein